MSPEFTVVIPARYASTRLPGKMLLPVAGRPLVAWTHGCALASGAARVVIATDDERVAATCRELGAEVEMTSGSHPSGSDRIAEVVDRLGLADQAIVVNLQGDEPLMPPALLSQVASDLNQRPGHAIATLCVAIDDAAQLFDPAVVKVVRDRAGNALYFSRAPIPWHRDAFAAADGDVLPPTPRYYRHLGLYAYRAGFLRRFAAEGPCASELAESLEQLRALDAGERIHVAITGTAPPPGVDNQDDLLRVRAALDSGVRE